MPDARVDVVTVTHRLENQLLAARLAKAVESDPALASFTAVDNSVENRGFARGCNEGARRGSAPIIAFLNPDLVVSGPLLTEGAALFDEDPLVVIAGERFGRDPNQTEYVWGCNDWVCGACFFVARSWFESVGGFCEDYVWSYEETDLCRVAEAQGYRVRSVELPVLHVQEPDDDVDRRYKETNLKASQEIFFRRWAGR